MAKINYNHLRMQREKKMPPNMRELIPQDTIFMFDEFGQIGWKFVSD